MGIATSLNRALLRATGRQLSRPVPRRAPRTIDEVLEATEARPPRSADDRLVPDPVFVLSSARAGSTLLRSILDSHSMVHAPIELHFRRVTVSVQEEAARRAMDMIDLDFRDLEHLLWDRVLHRELQRSGKRLIVEKTPSNVFVVERLATAWPNARFVYLLRNPLASALSWHEGDPEHRPMDKAIVQIAEYVTAVEAARSRYPGHTIRYEDLLREPEVAVRDLCSAIGVPFEPGMLDYGGQARGAQFTKGIGDWSDKIRSGRIQPGRELPATITMPDELLPIAQRWDYAAA